MPELFRQEVYPPAVRVAIETMPPLAIAIANHWMRKWPEKVQALIDSGEYSAALSQETIFVLEMNGYDATKAGIAMGTGSLLGPPPQPKGSQPKRQEPRTGTR